MSEAIEGWVLAGNRDGQHGVIATDLDPTLAAEVARRIDLPGSLPSEFRSSELSAFGCFRHGDRFVFYEVSSDPSVRRVGMARSGAVVLGLQEAARIDDPSNFLAAARSTRLTGSPDEHGENPPAAIPRCVPLLSHLIVRPAMTSSEAETGDIIRAVWSALPRTLRPGFSARLCFSPDDLPEKADIALGFIPESLRWRCPDELRVVDPCGSAGGERQNDTLAERLVDGESRTWEEFADSHALRLKSFRDLNLVASIEKAATADADLNELVRALRYALSLRTGDGRSGLLDDLAGRIAEERADWTPDDVAALRNLELDARSPLKKAVGEWTDTQLAGSGNYLATVCPEVWGSGAQEWWTNAIEGSLRRHRGRLPRPVLSSFLERLAEEDVDASSFSSAIAASERVDSDLAAIVPDFDGAPSLLVSKLDAGRFPRTAVRARLADGQDLAELAGTGLRISSEEPKAVFFEELVRNVDPHHLPSLVVLDQTGEMVQPLLARLANQPDAFDAIDLSKAPSQQFFAKAILGKVLNADRLNLHLEGLMERLVEGASLEKDLADALIARKDVAFPLGAARTQVWNSLPDALRKVMLHRAACTWLNDLASGEAGTPEDEVMAALRSGGLADARREALRTADLPTWVLLVELEPSPGYAHRQRLLEILDDGKTHALAHVVSMAETLTRKNPDSVVSTLVSRHRKRRDLIPAWPILKPVIGFWDWLIIPNASIRQDEWDRALVEELATLYPEGPTQEDVWERAGGRSADVTKASSGTEGWRRAIRKVGRGARVGRSHLLAVALEDYPRNTNLKILRDNRPT